MDSLRYSEVFPEPMGTGGIPGRLSEKMRFSPGFKRGGFLLVFESEEAKERKSEGGFHEEVGGDFSNPRP